MLRNGIYALLDVDRLGGAQGDAAAQARLEAYADAARHAGAIALQIRYKSVPLGDPRRQQLAARLRRSLGDALPLLVDDDVEAARLAGCGVHLGQSDAPPQLARQALGQHAWIGYSTHDLGQIEAAQRQDVQYLGFGPVRVTASKQRAEPVTGWAQLADACAASALPVVAIGGLELSDVWTARACGAAAMAVIGAWLGPADRPHTPEQAHQALCALVQQWHLAPAAKQARPA